MLKNLSVFWIMVWMKGINFTIILNRKMVMKLYRLVTDFVDASPMTYLNIVVASLVIPLQSYNI